jgi:hypothetical protein
MKQLIVFLLLAIVIVVSDYWQAERINHLQIRLQIGLYQNRIILWETLWNDDNGDVTKAVEHYQKQIERLQDEL